jgi:spore coat protein U-like protein
MFKFNSTALAVALAAAGMVSATGVAVAATASNNVGVSATLTSGCEVAAGGTIAFADFVTLASAGNQTASSGNTFTVACSSDVTPKISSASSRTMAVAGKSLPFNLSLTSGAAADDLPVDTATAALLTLTKDGTMKVVPLYATVLAANFTGVKALPAGTYITTVAVDVSY